MERNILLDAGLQVDDGRTDIETFGLAARPAAVDAGFGQQVVIDGLLAHIGLHAFGIRLQPFTRFGMAVLEIQQVGFRIVVAAAVLVRRLRSEQRRIGIVQEFVVVPLEFGIVDRLVDVLVKQAIDIVVITVQERSEMAGRHGIEYLERILIQSGNGIDLREVEVRFEYLQTVAAPERQLLFQQGVMDGRIDLIRKILVKQPPVIVETFLGGEAAVSEPVFDLFELPFAPRRIDLPVGNDPVEFPELFSEIFGRLRPGRKGCRQ